MMDLCELAGGPTPHPQSRIALSRRQPGAPFVETTYGDLWQRAQRVANLLGSPAETPAFLPILAGKSADSIACLLAAMATGRTFCVLNPKYRAPQIAAVLEATHAPLCAVDGTGLLALRGALRDHPRMARTRWLLLDAGCLARPAAETAAELRTVAPVLDLDSAPSTTDVTRAGRRDVDPQAAAACLFTSGSTGQPKGVLISAADLRQRTAAEIDWFGLSHRDVLLSILPLSFDVGLNQLLTALTVGAELVLLDSWLPVDILAAAEQRHVTGISAVPAIWQDMMQSGARFDRRDRHTALRYVTISGGSLSRAQLERLPEVVDGADIFKTYGQTEAFRSTSLRPADFVRKRDSVGTPFPGVHVYVVHDDATRCAPGEAGEVVHTGLGTMLGYLGAGGQPDPNDKVRPNPFVGPDDPSPLAVFTGDTGHLDADGYLHLTGRRDSMLKILGNRVYPQEVTAQVLSLPGIRDAVVVGVPRPDGQTALVAFLVPAAPGEPTAGTVRKLLNARLPAYMVPREFVFVDRIPRTATGKADPHTLVATYAAGAVHP